jgi:hypothetical protein
MAEQARRKAGGWRQRLRDARAARRDRWAEKEAAKPRDMQGVHGYDVPNAATRRR